VTGTAYTWGLLIENHLDQSLWSTNQKYWVAVMSNLLHFFFEVHNCVAPFTSHRKLHEFGAEKLISWAKPAHFDFFAINFTVWSHILSTSRDALRAAPGELFILGLYEYLWYPTCNVLNPFPLSPIKNYTAKVDCTNVRDYLNLSTWVNNYGWPMKFRHNDLPSGDI